jgi:hypothetical protein
MAAKSLFYLSEQKDFKGKLFFKQIPEDQSGRFGTSAVTELDLVATQDHVKSYRQEYTDFKKANPKYVLQWPELDVEIVEPKVVVPEGKVEVVVLEQKVEVVQGHSEVKHRVSTKKKELEAA